MLINDNNDDVNININMLNKQYYYDCACARLSRAGAAAARPGEFPQLAQAFRVEAIIIIIIRDRLFIIWR